MRPKPRQLLAKAKVPVLLVTDLTDVRYLTGVSVSSGTLLVTPTAYVFLVDSRYGELASAKAYKDVTVKNASALPELLKKIPRCGYMEEHLTVARLRRLQSQFKNTKFVHIADAVGEFRRSKDEVEVRLINRAHRITRELLRRIPAALRVGIREDELAWKIEQWAHELGAEAMAFDSIVAFGSNTSRPHHQPGNRKLKKGDIVQIDIGAKYRGYCSDRSQVYLTGPVSAHITKAIKAVTKAKNAAKKAVKKGASTQLLDRIARDVLKKYGMEGAFTHALGHGVGLDIHEGVILSERAADQKLLKHEVITIEPGVYFPGKFGIRLEDMVIVE
ncbi:MAG TPA: aminopeptidase P family protein [Candidatus Peribacteraceae bacterium]|nr:aminopeptidase P family protein [Candidatus Peribacteraceae bacterium]